MPGPELHCLTKCSNVNRLMTFNAANVVVGWSKSVINSFTLTEDELIVFKSAVASSGRWLGFGNALVDRRTQCAKTVEEVVGLGIHVGRECFSCALAFDGARYAKR